MAKKKRSGHKMSGTRKLAKTVGTLVSDALILTPVIYPALDFSGGIVKGVPATAQFDYTLQKMGININQPNKINWTQAVSYGIMSAAAVSGGILMKKYVVKRV